jgi:hypothetical protein
MMTDTQAERARLKAAIQNTTQETDTWEGWTTLLVLRAVGVAKATGCGAEALLAGVRRVEELLSAVLPFVQRGENDAVVTGVTAELEAEEAQAKPIGRPPVYSHGSGLMN